MDNNKFDYLLPEITGKLTESFLDILATHPAFRREVDTAPLLNLTMGVYIGSLVRILDVIKENTDGEERLIQNICLAKNTIMKAIEDLPFIKGVEYI